MIESGWNDKIEGVYAEVSILNKSSKKSLTEFKTSSTSLTSWEKKKISGFFDTSNFSKGFYDANITLIYYGGETGKSSSEIVKIEFIKATSKILLIILIILAILIILTATAIILIKKGFIQKTKEFIRQFIKNEKEKRKKKRKKSKK